MGFMENLRAFRIRAGYSSAKKFADALGIPYNTYLSYESKHCEPNYNLLCKLADIFHTSTDNLLGHMSRKYIYSFRNDGFCWSNEFNTLEDALAAAREEAKLMPECETVYIGVSDDLWKPTIDGWSVIDMICEMADEEVGEVAETYLSHVPDKDVEELTEALTTAFNRWATKFGYVPNFFAAKDVKEYAL